MVEFPYKFKWFLWVISLLLIKEKLINTILIKENLEKSNCNCNPIRDSLALLDLNQATDINWNLNEPIRTWNYIQVNEEGCIESFNHNPSGRIPISFFRDLTCMKYLTINRFSDLEFEIPPEIGNMSNLEELTISNNFRFTSQIPPELGNLTSLKRIDFSDNSIKGAIPPEIGKLVNLEYLDFSGNDLSDSIPPEFGELINLKHCYLQNNFLDGSLPDELGKLVALEELKLWSNSLNGTIPPEISNLNSLKRLNLNNNSIKGPIPPEIGKLTSLEYLDFSDNSFNDSIPSEFGSLDSLELFDLSNSKINGFLPPELGKLKKVEVIYLDDNNINGEIPAEWSGMISLKKLWLSNNELTGTIPPSFNQLINLSELNLYNNFFSIDILEDVTIIESLWNLSLSGNNLKGMIPKILIEANINELRLSDNDFVSMPIVPDSQRFNSIYVRNNRLTFEDIIPNILILGKSESFYIPQKKFSADTNTLFNPCDNPIIKLSIDTNITNNQYVWLKNGDSVYVSNENQLNLRNIFPKYENYPGIYSCLVTNPLVPKLTLYSGEIIVELETDLPSPDTIIIEKKLCLGNSIVIAGKVFNCLTPKTLLPVPDSITGCITIYDIQLDCQSCKPNVEQDIPTAFSPNGDGVNESFIIPKLYYAPKEFSNNQLTVYNIRNQMVYQKQNYTNDWTGNDNEGQELPLGTYLYVFKYQNNKYFSGKITIIR